MEIDLKKVIDMVYCAKCDKYIPSLEFEGHECKTIANITSNAEVIK